MYIIINSRNIIVTSIIENYETAEKIKSDLLSNFRQRFRNTELYICEVKKIE